MEVPVDRAFSIGSMTGNTDASMLSPLLLGLAATATFLALAVAGILAALYRKHSNGRPGSPKHAPIVCDPPNTGATTPVHPQTKQAVDDIDPDIIPNEYGEYTTFRLFETWLRVMIYVHAKRRVYTLGIYFCNFQKSSMEIKWIPNNLKMRWSVGRFLIWVDFKRQDK